MKELFNTLSNVSQFLREKHFIYDVKKPSSAPQGPETNENNAPATTTAEKSRPVRVDARPTIEAFNKSVPALPKKLRKKPTKEKDILGRVLREIDGRDVTDVLGEELIKIKAPKATKSPKRSPRAVAKAELPQLRYKLKPGGVDIYGLSELATDKRISEAQANKAINDGKIIGDEGSAIVTRPSASDLDIK